MLPSSEPIPSCDLPKALPLSRSEGDSNVSQTGQPTNGSCKDGVAQQYLEFSMELFSRQKKHVICGETQRQLLRSRVLHPVGAA